jgi:hypothetical protein
LVVVSRETKQPVQKRNRRIRNKDQKCESQTELDISVKKYKEIVSRKDKEYSLVVNTPNISLFKAKMGKWYKGKITLLRLRQPYHQRQKSLPTEPHHPESTSVSNHYIVFLLSTGLIPMALKKCAFGHL